MRSAAWCKAHGVAGADGLRWRTTLGCVRMWARMGVVWVVCVRFGGVWCGAGAVQDARVWCGVTQRGVRRTGLRAPTLRWRTTLGCVRVWARMGVVCVRLGCVE